MRTKLSLALGAAVAALVIALPAAAANKVINGDFSADNTGFGSDYTFTSTDLGPPAVYAIQNNPHNLHSAFSSYGDHTTGTGLMMVVNGSQASGSRVWFENGLHVTANTLYFFSTWISSAHPASPARLDFSINGAQIGTTFMANGNTGVWDQFYATWESGAATTANIALVNRNTDFSGNDFALDDIQLDTVLRPLPSLTPEPASWALMIMGFGSAGAMLRRRRTATAAI